jgi:hypothetical protein
MPTTASRSYACQKCEPFRDPQDARTRAVKFVASAVDLVRGQIMAQVTSSGLWGAYDATSITGLETARGILVWDTQVSSAGLVSYAETASTVGDEWGVQFNDGLIYVSGAFRTTDLTGLTAEAIEDLGARLETGSIADGVLRIG